MVLLRRSGPGLFSSDLQLDCIVVSGVFYLTLDDSSKIHCRVQASLH